MNKYLSNLKILIIIETIDRELLGFLLLKKKLENNKINVYFCNRHNFLVKYNYILPQVVIVPQLFKIEGLKSVKDKSYIIYLRAESHAGNHLFSLADYKVGKKILQPNAIFCWGDIDYEIFKKFLGLKTKIKIYKSGHPSIDIWHKYSNINKKKNNTVGVCSTIRMVMSSTGSRNPIELIINVKNNKDWFGKNIFIKKNHGAEFFIGYEYSFLNFIVDFCNKYKKKISIRPSLNEDLNLYNFLKKNSKIEIDNQSNVLDWLLKHKTILCYKSSVGLTAYILGLNVINIKNFFNHKLLEGMNQDSYNFSFDNFFNKPKNYYELINLIKSKFKKNKKIEAMIEKTYSYNFKKYKYSSQNILDFLINNIEVIEKIQPAPVKFSKFTNNKIINLLYKIVPYNVKIFLIDTKIVLKNYIAYGVFNRQLYSTYNNLRISKIKKNFKKIEFL